ncbi:MAG: hypothetical protein ACYC99_00910 [Candidatus Geothermincolia bacterium]
MKDVAGSAARRVRTVGVGLLIALVLAAQAGVQRSFEAAWPGRGVEQFIYLPSGRHTKALTLGFSNLAADVLWIRAVSYFGGHVLTDNEYPWLYRILVQVTSLDPPFMYPYLFGGMALALKPQHGEESVAMLTRGMINYPGDWRYPFYIGFNAFYNQRDPERAAGLMRYAASLPGSPQYLPPLAASLLAETGRVDAAVRFLETMAEGTRDQYARAKILRKIEDLRANRIPESLKSLLAGERAP